MVDEKSPSRSTFTIRIVAIAFAVDLLFTLLVPVVYVRMLGIAGPTDVQLVVALLLPLDLAKVILLVVVLPWMLRPIERWHRAGPGGDPDGALLRRAGQTVYRTPLAFGAVFASAWGLSYLVLTVLLRYPIPDLIPLAPRGMPAGALFAMACFTAALPLGYAMFAWLLAPTAGELSLVARARAIALPGREPSLRARLVLFGICLTLAPASWMASMAYMAEVPTTTILLSGLVVLIWGPICAAFIAAAVGGPVARIAAAVRDIGAHGRIDRSVARVPIFQQDDIGRLASGVNDMLDRLDESTQRVQGHLVEQERLAEVARRRAGELHAVLDHMVEGVMVCDAAGQLLLINRSGAEGLGLSSTDAVRHMWLDLPKLLRFRAPDGQVIPESRLPLPRALAGETVVGQEVTYYHPRSDRDRRIRASAAPIRDEAGAIVGVVQVAHDVTELAALDRLKDQFIRVAAHELKTPVTIVKGYAQLLLGTTVGLSSSQRTTLEAIGRGADRLDALVRDLLDVSQLYLGRWKLGADEIDLAALAAAAVERLSPSLRRHRIRIVRADRAIVVGDRRRLEQVQTHLLENALKFSPDGGEVEIEVAARDGEVFVSVVDGGVGIARDKQPRIFEPFYRAHTDTAHDHGGMGVGLYICKEIIEHHGGTFWFTSEEGQGSVFSYSLPLKGAAG
ncbi:MAG: HAMP domain-containing protein [Myxococcales bacterium]|nr:HAMP domain-containing protein [Myxococcales bacterium]